MKVLSVNAGSSSLKFQMYEMPSEEVLISGVFERIGIEGGFYSLKINGDKVKKEKHLESHDMAVSILIEELISNDIVKDLDEIKAVGHRVVHGGDKYSDSVVIDDDVLNTIVELSDLAPLHNPANVTGIKAFFKKVPNATAVAVFDTAFHQTIEKEEFLSSGPLEWYEDHKVRKYSFHGTSHKYITERMKNILNKDNVNLITCHLGNGASISAIKDGESKDSTMGFTPNAGLIMGTRSGDFDFTIIPYIMEVENKTLDEVLNDLNKKSGLLGISKISSDSRDIEDAFLNNDENAVVAQNMYVKRIVSYIAKYYVFLKEVDAITFSGGIGENSSITRKMIIDELVALGIKVDDTLNEKREDEFKITKEDSKVDCYVIKTDEEVMIAKETYELAK